MVIYTNGAIGIGNCTALLWHEIFARHGKEGGKNIGIVDPAYAKLAIDHCPARCFSSLLCCHCALFYHRHEIPFTCAGLIRTPGDASATKTKQALRISSLARQALCMTLVDG